jgi:hypothetical protein
MTRITFSLLLLALLGCGGANQLETAPVSGRVTLDGKPLERGTVTFLPERGRVATGEIQTDGTFTLGTYSERDGAIVGRHRVAVVVVDQAAAEALAAAAPASDTDIVEADAPLPLATPAHYADPGNSGLTFEVKAGESNEAVFELTSP